MKIRVLTENLVYNEGLKAEHGLSIYLEDENTKILFDTGQSGIFIENAICLGIDIKEVDYLVISHGHYDHCGALADFLQLNNKAKIIIKKEALEKKYSKSTGVIREIGLKINLEENLDRIIFVDDIYKINEKISVLSKFEKTVDFENSESKLFVKRDNEYVKDEFLDEEVLIIEKEDKIKLITACSHNGIVNIIKTIEKRYGKEVDFVLGGLHLKSADEERMEKTLDYFIDKKMSKIAVNHCSGLNFYSRLKAKLGEIGDYAYTGREYEI